MNSSLDPRLKIGIISAFMPPHLGGIELVAENLFRAYREAGHRVSWMASRVPAQAPGQEEGRLRVGCWNWLEGLLGVPWPVWGPAALRPLITLIKWADVLHIHDCLYYSSALALVLARRWNKPVLLSQHVGAITYPSAMLNALASLAYKTLGRTVLRGVSHVVFCTPAAEDFCQPLSGGQLKAFSSIPVGVDLQRFHPASHEERCQARLHLGLTPVGPVILFVGRLQEKKGAMIIQEVAAAHPKIHFLMVGDGPLRPGPKENLTWLPLVPPENMPRLYHAADGLLLPSFSEGLPLVLLEAMASGVPVIVSRGLHIGDSLEQESAGWTSERTAAGFAAALTRLLEAPKTVASMTRRARRLVELRWSNRVMALKYLSLIQQIIKTPGPGPIINQTVLG